MRILCLLILFYPLHAFSQQNSTSNGVSWGTHYMGGKIFIHTKKIHVDEPAYSSGIELSYNQQTTGTKDWHQRFGFPEASVNLFFSDYGSQQLGMAVGIYPAIQFRIVTSKRINWYYKFGGGIGFVSKHWERTPAADSMNNIIGSTVNNFTMFQTGVRFFILKNWTAQAGLHFYHLSNAAARSPNFGINTFGANLGLNYHPQSVARQFEKRNLKHVKNPLNLCLWTALAFAEDKAPDGPLFPVFTGTISGYKMYRNKNKIIVGVDAIFNTRTRALIRNAFQMNGDTWISPWQYTAFIGHEFLFGRVGFPVIAGKYINRPVGGEKIYQKLGMNFHFYKRKEGTFKDAFLSLMLKTHLIQAQYAEIGFGFFL